MLFDHEQISSHIAMLIQNDLLNLDNQAHLLSTTSKGLKFVRLYEGMIECLGLKNEELQQRQLA
jgi:predicted transcriptional regulator